MRKFLILPILYCLLALILSACGKSDGTSAIISGGPPGSPGGAGGDGSVVQWSVDLPGGASSIGLISSVAVAPDGTIYVGSGDHSLYAFRSDGALKWKYETGDAIVASPAVGSDGTIYVGSADRQFYAINPDGTLRWVVPTKSVFTASAAIGSDGTIYAAGTNLDLTIICTGDLTVQLSDLYAISPNGTLKWLATLSGEVHSSPALATDGTIYVGSNGDVGFDRSNPCDTDSAYPPSNADPGFPVNGHLYAVNPNGTLKWDFKTLGHVESSPAIASDGTIYVGSDRRLKFYGADPSILLDENSQTTGPASLG